MPSASTVTALLALVLGGGVALGLARIMPQRVRLTHAGLSWAPSVLMVVAFLLDGSGLKILTFGALVLSMAFYCLAWLTVGLLARRPGALSLGGLGGVITIVGLLYTFGSLLQVRLDYQRNPAGGPFDGLQNDALSEFLASQGPPLVILAAAIVAILAGPALGRLMKRLVPLRLQGWVATHPPMSLAVAVSLVIGLFLLPIAGSARNGAHLAFLGIQTSEWVRPLWILVTAYLLASHRHYLNWRALRRRDPSALTVAMGLAVLIGGVAVAGWLRNDWGSVLPFVFAAPAMILTLAFQDRDTWLSSMGYRDSLAANPLASPGMRRVGLGVLALASIVVLLSVNLTIPGNKGRVEAWQNPWQFAWTPPCTSVEAVPDWVFPGAGYSDPVPAGYELCVETQADANKSANSQTALALTVIDGGGLWGRGLNDTESGIVPLRNSDFILAATWSKLGGLTVLLSSWLVVALGYLLVRRFSRTAWEGRPDSRSDRAHLYATGLAAVIVGQAGYVVLATTNVAFLTGVPFPFLARGGQAMGGLVLGIGTLVWLVRQTEVPTTTKTLGRHRDADFPVGVTRRARLAFARTLGLWLAAAASVAALVVGLAIPFASKNPLNPHEGMSNSGVQKQLRARGLAPLLTVNGRAAFTEDRVTGAWSAPTGIEPAIPVEDLFGVLRTHQGGTLGLLEATEQSLLQPKVDRTVQDRLSETPTRRQVLDLTLDPRLQTVAAHAARDPVNGSDRLPAGVVVLDASTGAIRALSSAPDELDPSAGRASDAEVAAWYDANWDRKSNPSRGAWGELVLDPLEPDGPPMGVLKPGDANCNSSLPCGRYQLRAVADPLQDEDYLRTFVGGDAAFDLPNPAENRALGRSYNVGSTFKIVITAAYLESGGSITDRISSPDYVQVGGKLIGPRCSGTQDGTITLADALKVSCNPAFIQLARDLGWSAIAALAEKMGFIPVERAQAQHDPSSTPAAATIPATVDYQSIATNAIGGDLVTSTPYRMAAMMAAIANGGTLYDPYLIAGASGQTGSAHSPDSQGNIVLDRETARQLREGLAEVSGEGGTLGDVAYDSSKIRFYGKSGTHVARAESSSGQYTARYFWIVGAAERVNGEGEPIAFAVAVEGRDKQLGHEHVRKVVAKILEAYAEER